MNAKPLPIAIFEGEKCSECQPVSVRPARMSKEQAAEFYAVHPRETVGETFEGPTREKMTWARHYLFVYRERRLDHTAIGRNDSAQQIVMLTGCAFYSAGTWEAGPGIPGLMPPIRDAILTELFHTQQTEIHV